MIADFDGREPAELQPAPVAGDRWAAHRPGGHLRVVPEPKADSDLPLRTPARSDQPVPVPPGRRCPLEPDGAAARHRRTGYDQDASTELPPWLAEVPGQQVLRRRPVTRYDAELLTALFTDWRSGDFATLPISLGTALIEMQFRAHQRDRCERWADAVDEIIEVRGIPAGRLTTVQRGDVLRIVDLMLFNGFRDQGIGRLTVKALYHQAARSGLRLRATVAANALEADAQWIRWITDQRRVGELDIEIDLRPAPAQP